eukprot:8979128-Lingulodinium_polyedra.AAC.1
MVITVYVDDAPFEASGSDRVVCDIVVCAARLFTDKIVVVSVEFSPAKNTVFASRREFSYRIFDQLRGLKLK